VFLGRILGFSSEDMTAGCVSGAKAYYLIVTRLVHDAIESRQQIPKVSTIPEPRTRVFLNIDATSLKPCLGVGLSWIPYGSPRHCLINPDL